MKRVFSSFAAFVAVVASVAFLGGCVATQKDILDMESQMDDLKVHIVGLQRNQADLLSRMDQSSTQIAAFTENLKNSQSQMSKLLARLDDLEVLLSKSPGGTQGPTPGQIYRQAYLHLAQKNYDLAVQGFELYLEKFPEGELADSATYYLGDAYYSKRSWQEASKRYSSFLNKYLKSDLTPSARLKYALSLLNLDRNSQEGKRYLESIPKDYPESPEAETAQKYLDKLQ